MVGWCQTGRQEKLEHHQRMLRTEGGRLDFPLVRQHHSSSSYSIYTILPPPPPPATEEGGGGGNGEFLAQRLFPSIRIGMQSSSSLRIKAGVGEGKTVFSSAGIRLKNHSSRKNSREFLFSSFFSFFLGGGEWSQIRTVPASSFGGGTQRKGSPLPLQKGLSVSPLLLSPFLTSGVFSQVGRMKDDDGGSLKTDDFLPFACKQKPFAAH